MLIARPPQILCMLGTRSPRQRLPSIETPLQLFSSASVTTLAIMIYKVVLSFGSRKVAKEDGWPIRQGWWPFGDRLVGLFEGFKTTFKCCE